MSAQLKHHLFTEAEYWEHEASDESKHEYFRGELFLMAGASVRHNTIVLNAGSSLRGQLRGKSCRPMVSDQRIKTPRTGLQTYPDVVVVCPPLVRDPNNRMTLLDATVIIEVLSPSTAHYDKNQKFDFYQELPSLRHYLTVDQDKIEVIHNFWGNGEWEREEFTSLEAVISLYAIECELRVSEIYEDVEWE